MTSNGLVPLIRYRDVAAAVDWLSNSFGFEKRSVVTDSDGTVAYAELCYGHGIVMLGPVGQSVLDSLLKQPDELGGIGTQSVYVAVDDVEAHFNHARSAGAEIVLEFGSEEAGDRAYAARDPEGHVWNFGAYSPWPAKAAPPLAAASEPAISVRPTRTQAVLGGTVAAIAVASVVGLAALEPPPRQPTFAAAPAAPLPASAPDSEETAALKETLARETHARQEAARAAAAIREELAREKAERLTAETARRELERLLAETRAPAPPVAAATPPPQPDPAQPPTQSATAPAAPSTPPATTGSLGEQPREAALEPAAEAPAPPVTVAPATPEQAPAAAAAEAAKPKPEKPKTQAQRKPRPAPRRNPGHDPFFLYD